MQKVPIESWRALFIVAVILGELLLLEFFAVSVETNLAGGPIDWAKWINPAWIQAIGSVGAILAAVWIGHREYKRAEKLVADQHARENRERKMKAYNFAVGLYPELLELTAKLIGARDPEGRIRRAQLEIPPVLIDSVEALYLLDEAGASVQQFLSVARQFNRLIAKIGRKMPDDEVERALAPHLTKMSEMLVRSLQLVEPIHDGKELSVD